MAVNIKKRSKDKPSKVESIKVVDLTLDDLPPDVHLQAVKAISALHGAGGNWVRRTDKGWSMAVHGNKYLTRNDLRRLAASRVDTFHAEYVSDKDCHYILLFKFKDMEFDNG